MWATSDLAHEASAVGEANQQLGHLRRGRYLNISEQHRTVNYLSEHGAIVDLRRDTSSIAHELCAYQWCLTDCGNQA